MKVYGGDLVEIVGGKQGHVEATRYSLVGKETRYEIGGVGDIPESLIARIVSHGRHNYWAPKAGGKRGHCSRCGVKKSAHEGVK